MIAALRTRLRELSEDTESGQTLVEFALVFPVQLWLTVLIIQFAFIAHAYVVVGQAAFMGARAAAVADVNDPANPITARTAAATKTAARTVALLTSGGNAIRPATGAPARVPLEWRARDRTTGAEFARGYNQARQDEAYALLTVQVLDGGDHVSCEVEYNYVLLLPAVMPRLFGDVVNGQETFKITRVSFVPTPWNVVPLN